jgi:hypothetical protein
MAGNHDGEVGSRRAKTAAEICQHAALTDQAKDLLRDGPQPRPYFDLLRAQGLHHDAIRFLTHWLPKRELVWWAILCVREGMGADVAPAVEAALQAALRWVVEPTEENRRAAMRAAETATFASPAGTVALAAFLSEGSLAPPDVAAVVPAEYLSAQAAAGAILLAAVVNDPHKAPQKLARFVAQGLAVLEGTNRWEESPAGRPTR